MDRRTFIKNAARCAGAVALTGGSAALLAHAAKTTFWNIDPQTCISCGNCEKSCVLTPSASKCVNEFEYCGYCVYCFGYYKSDTLSEEPDNLVCPTRALKRRKVGEEQYEYTIDEKACIGCGKCVKRCVKLGNASLRLVIRKDRCLECNRCAIAKSCPTNAIKRVGKS